MKTLNKTVDKIEDTARTILEERQRKASIDVDGRLNLLSGSKDILGLLKYNGGPTGNGAG